MALNKAVVLVVALPRAIQLLLIKGCSSPVGHLERTKTNIANSYTISFMMRSRVSLIDFIECLLKTRIGRMLKLTIGGLYAMHQQRNYPIMFFSVLSSRPN